MKDDKKKKWCCPIHKTAFDVGKCCEGCMAIFEEEAGPEAVEELRAQIKQIGEELKSSGMTGKTAIRIVLGEAANRILENIFDGKEATCDRCASKKPQSADLPEDIPEDLLDKGFPGKGLGNA